MSSRRISRARTTRPRRRARRLPARYPVPRNGSVLPTRKPASAGAPVDVSSRPNRTENVMEKRQELYRGKAKTVYATDDPHYLVMHYRDDVSAFDGAKLAQLELKGETNNKFNAYIMGKLAAVGVSTHFMRVLNERESLVRAMKMIQS